MDLNKVVKDGNLKESRQLLQVGWESSQRSMPMGRPAFLPPEFVADACRDILLPAEVLDKAVEVSRRIAADSTLRALAWHYHHCLFLSNGYPLGNLNRWPSLTGVLGDDAGMFYFILVLSGLPGMRSVYEERSIPAEIARDTLSQVKFAMTEHRQRHGNWGLTAHNVRWFTNHLYGDLYCLGRLQFQFGFFHYKLRAFRHRTSGVVVALSEGGIRYLDDGQLDGRDRFHDATGAWTSQLTFADDEITGHPIAPGGSVLRQRVQLPKAEWQEVLAPGDPVLNIHIPGGGPMDYDLCGESFRAAMDFFPRHFPDKPFLGFCCGSWLLDSQLEELLPATSNIVRFQREVYLFPTLSDDMCLPKTVFGSVPDDLTSAPRDTALQRAVLDRLAAGPPLRAKAGGCFILPGDLDWGSQFYRSQPWPWQA